MTAEKSSEDGAVILFLAAITAMVIAVGFVGGCGIGTSMATKHIQTQATERGHGEWVTNSSGAASFRWKDQETTESGHSVAQSK
jgi:hypothetical protein